MATQQPLEEERTFAGGAAPTHEPRSQDSAGHGRGVGLGVTTILGIVLVAVPVVWAVMYLMQASQTGLGTGFVFLVGIVLLACLGAGLVLLRGLLKT